MTSLPPTTGPEAIMHALQTLDLDSLEQEQRDIITAKKKTARPRAIRLLNIISGLKKNDMSTTDLMLNHVPVIPPKFRPFSITGNTFLPGDANELYKDLIEYRRLYERTAKELGPENAGEVYADMNKAAKAAYGYGESPNPKTKARAVKGFFETVTGSSPKTSFYQSKMLSKPVDSVGRGVVVPDADLGMDEVGIPESMAWKLYGNYVQRRLVQSGMSPPSALRHVKDRSPQALKALESEMPNRPVVMTRSPAWHRTNVVGQIPHMVKGDAIQANTFIAEGMTLDHDGDLQHGCVVVAAPLGLFSYPPLLSSTSRLDPRTVTSMFAKLQLPVLDVNTHEIHVIDLEDFPRGEQLSEKISDQSRVRFFAAVAGCKVIAHDSTSGNPVWADVSHYSVHEGLPIEIVTLEANRQIFTDDDPRAVYAIDPGAGDLELRRFTPTQALEKKVVVPFVRDTREVMSACGLRTSVFVTEDDCVFASLPLTFRTGWLLGALCGDGWWDKRDQPYYAERRWAGSRCICLADLKGHNARRMVDILQQDLRVEDLREFSQTSLAAEDAARYGDTVKYTYNFKHSEKLAEFLSLALGGSGDAHTSGSANKHLPAFALSAPEAFRRGLLCGLVDTDGSCSVSHGKGKPQLMCAFSSTSLRMCREVQTLCATLGINASISFSRVTSGGNVAWQMSLSAPDCKHIGIFNDLACDWKRDAFINTHVSSEANSAAVFDKVVLPKHVAQRVMRDLPHPKIRPDERGGTSAHLRHRMDAQTVYTSWFRGMNSGALTRVAVKSVTTALEAEERHRLEYVAGIVETLEAFDPAAQPFTPELSKSLREAIRCTHPKQDTAERYKLGLKLAARLSVPLREGRLGVKLKQDLLDLLRGATPYRNALHDADVITWIDKCVNNTSISWSPVVAVEKTGQIETGYDLTVPGYETFMSIDGVILSNTSSIHVPSSKAAVADVKEKMMASKMLWSIKDRSKTLANPKHEQLIGLSMGYDKGGQKRRFATEDEAMKAIEDGQIDLNDDIEIDT